MSSKLRHYRCPTCGRLTSVPWEAPVWCLHHNSTFTPHGPESDETDWTVMKPFYPDALEDELRDVHAARDRLWDELAALREAARVVHATIFGDVEGRSGELPGERSD